MRYMVVAESDVGIRKKVNQDSIVIKHILYGKLEVVMAVVCDGLGGLSKGEVASANVIWKFDEWFKCELIKELKDIDVEIIGYKWALMLKDLNVLISEYGQISGEKLGTTFTGVLIIGRQYVVVHVGDTRLYYIGKKVEQLTEDHTYVERQIKKGLLTVEQAKTSKYKNILLQCVGASKLIEPQIIYGNIEEGLYLLCSDGFSHKVANEEMMEILACKNIKNKKNMKERIRFLIDTVKERGEKDNISVIIIKVKHKNNYVKV